MTSPISDRIANDSGSPYFAPVLGLSLQNSLCWEDTTALQADSLSAKPWMEADAQKKKYGHARQFSSAKTELWQDKPAMHFLATWYMAESQ